MSIHRENLLQESLILFLRKCLNLKDTQNIREIKIVPIRLNVLLTKNLPLIFGPYDYYTYPCSVSDAHEYFYDEFEDEIRILEKVLTSLNINFQKESVKLFDQPYFKFPLDPYITDLVKEKSIEIDERSERIDNIYNSRIFLNLTLHNNITRYNKVNIIELRRTLNLIQDNSKNSIIRFNINPLIKHVELKYIGYTRDLNFRVGNIYLNNNDEYLISVKYASTVKILYKLNLLCNFFDIPTDQNLSSDLAKKFFVNAGGDKYIKSISVILDDYLSKLELYDVKRLRSKSSRYKIQINHKLNKIIVLEDNVTIAENIQIMNGKKTTKLGIFLEQLYLNMNDEKYLQNFFHNLQANGINIDFKKDILNVLGNFKVKKGITFIKENFFEKEDNKLILKCSIIKIN